MRHLTGMPGRLLFIVLMLGGSILGALVLAGTANMFAQSPADPQDQPSAAAAQDDGTKTPEVTEERPMSFWMEKKLDYSKAILESLTKGEFDKLAKEADQMRALGKIEGFVRRKNESYRTQLRTFDFASQELVRQAKRNNAEGAALAFNQLTNSCVACHVMLREGIE